MTALVWTKERPTVRDCDSPFWYRGVEDNEPRVGYLSMCPFGAKAGRRTVYALTFLSVGSSVVVEHAESGAEWAGPISPPVEPSK